MVIEPIEVSLGNRNYKHFESLGYSIKKKKGYNDNLVIDLPQSIFVKFNDIPKHSSQKINVICDICGKLIIRSVADENIYLEKCNIDTCTECGSCKMLLTKQKKYGTTNPQLISQQTGIKAGRSRKYDINMLYDLANLNGYILRDDLCDVSNILVKNKYTFECSKHHCIFDTFIYALVAKQKNCPKCKSEYFSQIFSKSTIDEAKDICLAKDYTIVSTDIKNCDDDIFYICNKHKNIGLQKTSLWGLKHYNNNCRYCKIPSGDTHWHWSGGISNIKEYFRNIIQPWKVDSFKKYDYRCDITGVNNDIIIHHLYNFADIVNETFVVCNLDIKQQISDYTDSEIKMLEEKCLELHYKYGLGVCLSENVHKKFHSLYGIYNNTPEQYYEFKTNIANGSIVID